MRGDRRKRISEQLQQVTAEYFSKVANRSTLLTITRVTVSSDLKHATIFFTVLPENKEKAALAFLTRHGSELRAKIKKELNMRNIPFFDFKIDKGEKNFYRIIESDI